MEKVSGEDPTKIQPTLMKENTRMTRRMEKESLSGLLGTFTQDIIRMMSEMV